jgi:NADPH:quinone reductase-like Zn-dependent oxidoreductase
VLGKDFTGTVDAFGAGVEGSAVGYRVFVVVAKSLRREGRSPGYVIVPTAVRTAHPPALDIAVVPTTHMVMRRSRRRSR